MTFLAFPVLPSRVVQGTLLYDQEKYTVEWSSPIELTSGHGEEGRGMELSELILWNGRMYTMDDRSGIVFEIVDYSTPKAHVVPRFILMEGDGNTDKGFKGEWAAVKDGNLIIASFGKEYANNDGTIKNKNNNWVAEITPAGKCVCPSVLSADIHSPPSPGSRTRTGRRITKR